MDAKARLRQLVRDIAETQRQYDLLAFDEEYDHEPGPPCPPQRIAALKRILGAPLPPSYRAFMELHDGWDSFLGGARILSVEDHGSDWVQEKLELLDDLFTEFDVENPFKHGAIPVLLGEDEDRYTILDPRTARPDGEMDLIALDIVREERRYPDFVAFLEDHLERRKRMVAAETSGVGDDLDED